VIGPRVTIVEDDPELRGMIVDALRDEGFRASGASSGRALLARIGDDPPDALVVDIGLPDADGRDVCQALRAQGIGVPVLFLTARDALPDRLAGFDAGGDDYMTKPFALAELIARLHVLVRRGGGGTAVSVGGVRLDPAAHAVAQGDTRVALTPTEFRLLATLAAHPGEAVRRRELVRSAWPRGAIVHENTLDAHLARLRRKLGTLPAAPAIGTVHGVGYRLE
jgi:two-component system response regulator MprA